MKKLIILVMMLLGSSLTFANVQQDSTNQAITLSEMPSAVYNDVKDAVSAIAAGIGTTAEYVWPILIKQQVVKAWVSLVTISSFVILGLCFIPLGWFLEKNSKADVAPFFYVVGGVALAVGLICIAFGLNSVLAGFINPEYGAIQEIFKLIN